MNLGGASLVPSLVGGFVPLRSATFTVLKAGTLNGTLGNIVAGGRLDMGAAGSFAVTSAGNQIVLSDYRPLDTGTLQYIR